SSPSAPGYIAEWPAHSNRARRPGASPAAKGGGGGGSGRSGKTAGQGGQRPQSRRTDIRIQCLCIDTADPARLAAFWQAALGWRLTVGNEDEVVLEPPEGSPEDGVAPDLLFLRVPEEKAVKNRLHVDLRPGDQAAEAAAAARGGAPRVQGG